MRSRIRECDERALLEDPWALLSLVEERIRDLIVAYG